MRGKQAPKRSILPDPKYKNHTVAKFINYTMLDGKKSTAQKVVYDAFDLIQARTEKPGVEVFDEAIKNVGPLMEVRSRRVGGANYQVPIPTRGERKLALTFRWILDASRKKSGKPMAERLANELIAAANKEGDAMKKRNDVHRMAEANRAFAHFAYFKSR